MTKIDNDKIKKKLDIIMRERVLLDDFVGIPYEEFVSPADPFSSNDYYAALHRLQLSLQAVLDISQYIVSHEVLGNYKENKEVFGLLAEKKIITTDLAKSLELAIGTRNIMVHQYEDVDPKVIYDIIQTKLSDFDAFVDQIVAFTSRGLNEEDSA